MHHAIQTRKYFALVIWRSKQGQIGLLLSPKASDVEHTSERLESVTNASFKQVIFWHEKQNQTFVVSIFKEISGIMKTREPSVDTSCEQNISIFDSAPQKKQQI